jgi:DNA-binding YbaB/EbfC family protein
MNIQKLMRQAQQMQDQMQRELAELVVETSVGGGAVKARMSGHKQLLAIEIDREVLDPDDPTMLQDLVVSAVNEAARRVDEEMRTRLGGLTGSMPRMF